MKSKPWSRQPAAAVLALACLLPWISATSAASLDLYHSDYRKTSEWDPGSLRVFVKNTSDAPVEIRHVLLNEMPIPVWGLTNDLGRSPPMPEYLLSGTSVSNAPIQLEGRALSRPYTDQTEPVPPGEGLHVESSARAGAHDRARSELAHRQVIWARLRPPRLQPGEVAEFVAKLAKPSVRPFKIGFIAADRTYLAAVVRPRDRQLVMTAITFSDNLAKAYGYLENRSDRIMEISSMELDGSPVNDGLWFSSSTIRPGEKQVVAVTSGAFARGGYHTFCVRTAEGHSVAERLRVSSFFPLTVQMSFPQGDEDYALDTGAPIVACQGADIGGVDMMATNKLTEDAQSVYIFGCVMHAYRADLTRTAQQVFAHHDRYRAQAPFLPSCIAPCKIRPEEGYGKFGETADVLQFNPLITTGSSGSGNEESADVAVARIAGLARSGSAPRPVHAIVPTHKLNDPTEPAGPEDVRRLAYSLIGQGAKGLIYRHRAWDLPEGQAVNQAIGKINREIRGIRPWLATSDVVTLGEVAAADVSLYTLLCPDRGIVVLLVNHDEQRSPKEAKIRIDVPDWLAPERLMRVEPRGLQGLQELGDNLVDVRLPIPVAAAAYLIECSKRSR